MTTTTEVPVDIAPLEMMTQKEQWAHLRDHHMNMPWGLGSRSKKPDFEQWHTKAHSSDQKDESKPDYFRTSHTHTAGPSTSLVVHDGDGKGQVKLPTFDKPLQAGQRKALKELVENDFAVLRAEIHQFADDEANRLRAEVRKEWAKKGADAPKFTKQAQDLLAKFHQDRQALIAKALAAGVEVEIPKTYDREVSTKVAGLDDAIRQSVAGVEADRKRALNALERSRLSAQRAVLMSGVTTEGLALLETIPTAQALMLEAGRQRSTTVIEHG